MAICTQNLKIFSPIIVVIFVDMMDSENFFNFIISTYFTFIDDAPSLPKFSEIICFFWFNIMYYTCLVRTCFRTIFSFSIRVMQEFGRAMKAKMFYLHSLTFFRTVFSSFLSIFSYTKIFETNFTL